ncbi:MAG: hypothetical protein AMXMBFR53_04590 [Gemmatimonadota bacterium]
MSVMGAGPSRTALWAAGLLAAGIAAAPPAAAQVAPVPRPTVRAYAADSTVARAPFGPGELLTYKVKIGIFNAGEGHMAIPEVDTVRGRDAYHINMAINGGLGPARVNDRYDSWLDIRTLQSWRFIQDIHEVNYRSFRHYEFYPERKLWDREDNDEFGELGSLLPLDDIAFIYFIRTLPLEVGRTYSFDRYFKGEGNPVSIQVLRRDRRETDAGTFNTLVVRPIIRTRGLFQGGKAELHLTDDERRILVYMKSDIKNFPGSLTLHLQSIREGLPLHPVARDRALRGENREPPEPDTLPWP